MLLPPANINPVSLADRHDTGALVRTAYVKGNDALGNAVNRIVRTYAANRLQMASALETFCAMHVIGQVDWFNGPLLGLIQRLRGGE
jgi:hypothetical protein